MVITPKLSYNPDCSEDDTDQGIQCEEACYREYYDCRRKCIRDSACKRECATKKVRCENGCPCRINCFGGCPCDDYKCTSCQELHSTAQIVCVQKCHLDNNVNYCPYTNLTCMDAALDEYESCINTDCPCKAERKFYGCDSSLDMSGSSALAMMMSGINKAVIHRNMTEKTLQDNGFAKYFEIGAREPGPRLNDFLRSHPQTPELFIGCKHKLLNETLGIFISPKDLYLQTHFTYFDLSYARSNREYYVYYSDTYGEPFGFTEDQRIRLQGSDEFDCHNQGLPASKCAPEMMDDHRMTAATTMGSISLLRCGKNSKSNTQSFVANYETVGFYAL
ncbi:unnamed protein product [Oikopleura dioica]|uniref:Uncharacterized protein n=1 Tax=Oikopleura dioica TaxID=34765 RepID=E4Y9M7_OIKDI|nr:unnamed protein product [Oikopleura dioica]